MVCIFVVTVVLCENSMEIGGFPNMGISEAGELELSALTIRGMLKGESKGNACLCGYTYSWL